MGAGGHILNLFLVLIFGPLRIIPWVIIALCCANGNRKRMERKKDEELELLREIAGKGRRK